MVHGTGMIVALFTRLRQTITQKGLLNRAQWQWPILTDDSGVFDDISETLPGFEYIYLCTHTNVEQSL